MKIFLDDERQPPDDSWTLVRWPNEVISLIKSNDVEAISLDHDLGDDSVGTGYDVILWIEEKVALGEMTPPTITVHSANISARKKMIAGIKNIYKISQSINSKTAGRNQKESD